MRGGIYLHIRCDQDVVTDINAMVVHKSTVHVDDDLIADEDMLAIFAMEVDVHVNTLPDTAEQLAQQSLFASGIGVVRGIELRQQAFCPHSHFHYFRVSASVERLACHTFFVFCLHVCCFLWFVCEDRGNQ